MIALPSTISLSLIQLLLQLARSMVTLLGEKLPQREITDDNGVGTGEVVFIMAIASYFRNPTIFESKLELLY